MTSGAANDVCVIAVNDNAAIKQFIGLPRRLYGDDPHWVAPLDVEQKERIFGKNPLFEHAQCQAWIAVRNGVTVGRISAQVDALYSQYHPGKVGYFGMLEAENDDSIFAALLASAENWLRQRGIEEIQGPFNLSINEETGLLVEGFDAPPFIMMGHAKPYYKDALERLGYGKAKDMFTYTVSPNFVTPKVMTRLVAKAASGVKVRPLNRKRKDEEFEILRDIFNDAWAENWGFVPYTQAEFADMAKTLSFLLDDDNVQIAELNGRPVSFIVALPNINEASRDLKGRLLPFGWAKLLWRLKVRGLGSFRVPLMGVRREFHHTPLGPALAFLVIDAVRVGLVEREVKTVEMGWILENNAGMRNIIESIGGVEYKKYRVFTKPLPPSPANV